MRKYNFNEHFFDGLNEQSSYWLGFLYADGYVRMKDGKSGELKIKLKDTDKSHIEKFLNDIDCFRKKINYIKQILELRLIK